MKNNYSRVPISARIRDYMANSIPEDHHEEFIHHIAHCIRGIRQELFELGNPIKNTRVAMALIDETMHFELFPKIKPACKPGCGHCCHIFVAGTEEEAEVILKYCSDYNVPINWDAVKWHAENSRLEPEYLTSHPLKKRRCPFLNSEDKCSVYEARPISCRLYCVPDGNADKCDTVKYATSNVPVMLSVNADVTNIALMAQLLDDKGVPLGEEQEWLGFDGLYNDSIFKNLLKKREKYEKAETEKR